MKYRGFILILVLLLVMWGGPTFPSGDCKGQSCNDGGETTVSTDVTIGDTSVSVPGSSTTFEGSRAYSLSNSLGDVDIAGCLGSTQWSTPLFSKQKLSVNWPCLTSFYLKNGKLKLAAMAICNTEIRKEFASEQECRDAHDFEVEDYFQEELQQQAMFQADLNAKVENLEQSRRVVIQQPYLSDEKKARLREILDE